jgi:hypothetical protein
MLNPQRAKFTKESSKDRAMQGYEKSKVKAKESKRRGGRQWLDGKRAWTNR